MWRIAQLIEESGAGGNKNVKNASLWDDTSTAASHMKTKKIMRHINAVLNQRNMLSSLNLNRRR